MKTIFISCLLFFSCVCLGQQTYRKDSVTTQVYNRNFPVAFCEGYMKKNLTQAQFQQWVYLSQSSFQQYLLGYNGSMDTLLTITFKNQSYYSKIADSILIDALK